LSSSYKDFISQAVFPDVEKIYDDYCIDKKPNNFNDYKEQDHFLFIFNFINYLT